MKIELACDIDTDAIYKIECESFLHPWSKDAILGEINGKASRVYIAKSGDDVVGYIAIRTVCDEDEITRIAVKNSRRRQGIAERLIASTLKGNVCYLDVRADNTPAISLYKKLGFVQNGERQKYYSDGKDALLFVRSKEKI